MSGCMYSAHRAVVGVLKGGLLQTQGSATSRRSRSMAHSATGSGKIWAQEALRTACAVCFDVDSTVITVEAIDELAAFAGKKDEVAALTSQAMGGRMPFEVALEKRLAIMRPSQDMVQSFLSKHSFSLTEDLAATIEALVKQGVHVYLVSGGFHNMISPIAATLGIPSSRVYANTILFDKSGEYSGFDATALTSRDGGKAEVIRTLKATHKYKTVVMVGDGATDMQAKPPADAFIGYGGIARRAAVEAGADWYVTSFADVRAVLEAK